MKYFILVFFFHILCVPFSVAQKKISLVENMNLTECKISDYATSIRYVPLETSDACLLSEDLHIITTTQYIFVHDQIEYKMYRFDASTGKYLNMIGKRGQGPGEFTRLYGFYVDDSEKKCFLLDATGIYIYTYEGAFLKKISHQNLFVPTRMEKIGSYYVLNNMLYLDTKEELYLIDQQGKTIKEKALSHNSRIGFMIPTAFFYMHDGQCYYKNDLSGNIYLLDEKLNMIPTYLIESGKKAIDPKENQMDMSGRILANEKLSIGRIQGYKNNLYIPYYISDKCLFAIYDKITGSVVTAGKDGKSGLTDNLAYGPMILPPGSSLYQSCIPGQLVSWIYPGDIDPAEYPKGEFGKILRQLDEDSNPIIRMINLK